MTVPGLFDFIQDAIDRSAVAINVTYESSGYPQNVSIDYDLRLADDQRGFEIQSLDML
jgi:hypothetical protein